MLPLVPVRKPENHDVLQHAGLGHEQHENDIDMNFKDMLPLQQVFDLDRQDAMLEDGNQPRTGYEPKGARPTATGECSAR